MFPWLVRHTWGVTSGVGLTIKLRYLVLRHLNNNSTLSTHPFSFLPSFHCFFFSLSRMPHHPWWPQGCYCYAFNYPRDCSFEYLAQGCSEQWGERISSQPWESHWMQYPCWAIILKNNNDRKGVKWRSRRRRACSEKKGGKKEWRGSQNPHSMSQRQELNPHTAHCRICANVKAFSSLLLPNVFLSILRQWSPKF